jgi:phage terminase Nu1 subunit (DNA packaging protein)
MGRLITKSAFARMVGVSHAAIQKAIKNGYVVTEPNAQGRDRINIDDYRNVQYLKSDAEQRHRGKPPMDIPQSEPEPTYEQNAHEAAVESVTATKGKHENSQVATVPPPQPHRARTPASTGSDTYDLAGRYSKARTEKLEQQAKIEALKVARTRGELVAREAVYNQIMAYLDRLHSNLDRLGTAYLSDVGALIVDAGEVTPEHRAQWQDAIMGLIHETKEQVVKEMRSIAREGAA